MRHIMIDLETMSTRSNAAIISIGAVHFDSDNLFESFYMPVSLKSCMDLNLHTSQSTIDWWMKQSAEARAAWQTEDAPSLFIAMVKFTEWVRTIGTDKQICPWGNGADFDLPIIGSAYHALDAEPPWKYYNHRCFRTMRGMFEVGEMPRAGTYHHALDDALHQAKHLQKILHTFKIPLP